MKSLIKSFTPNFLLNWYHLILAHLADFIFGFPSKKIIVIGVTGTNGKSTTVNLIANILHLANHKVAYSSTVTVNTGDGEQLNPKKMTMPGRFFLQRMIRDAVRNNCEFIIVESSSEGILQHRQVGIRYDCMVFTNLTPEHIEAHGGFKNYKQAKLEYFRNLEKLPEKIIAGKKIPKIIVANADDNHAPDFLNFKVDKKVTYGKNNSADFIGSDLKLNEQGISFRVQNIDFNLKLKGIFDLSNSLAAIATISAFGVDLETGKQALEKIPNVPGRVEVIDAGQNFKVVVDYAYEPEEMRQLYETISHWSHGKIIQILGPTGGGRDKARIPTLGQMAANFADTVIITIDDPYDDDPQKLGEQMAKGATDAGKILDQNLFINLDRRAAFAQAFKLAGTGDLVLITGKGADQTMALSNGEYLPWDDRKIAREELKK